MTRTGKSAASGIVVGSLAFLLLACFAVIQYGGAPTPQSRLILIAGVVYALLISVRKDAPTDSRFSPGAAIFWTLGTGGVLGVIGMITGAPLCQWLGVVLLAYAGLRWSLPERHAANIASALFLLCWAHPLSGSLLGFLRAAIQHLSVTGAEWILHAFDKPVWADGLILRTAMSGFEIHEDCGGMTLEMSVVVCVLGAGALLKLSVVQRVVLMGAGIVQVVIVNAARMSFMVAGAWDKPAEWIPQSLLDPMVAPLVFWLVVIQGEVWVMNRIGPQVMLWRAVGRDDGRNEQLEARYGVSTPMLGRAAWVVISLAILLMALFLMERRSPSHRASMIALVADGLKQKDPGLAERAANAAIRLAPKTPSHKLLLARIELMRGNYAQALSRLPGLAPGPEGEEALQLAIRGLLGAGKVKDAQALQDQLPPALAGHPGIAMCVAELAARQGDVDRVVSNVVIAATNPLLTDRIRCLYPFLADHGQWAAIAQGDVFSPHRDQDQFRIALDASIMEERVEQTARLLQRNRTLWFGNPAILPHLQDLALRSRDISWVPVYADSLTQCMAQLSADGLTSCFEPCFALGRPDLAWSAYERLARMDSRHPALSLVPALFAAKWYVFRGDSIGMTGGGARRVDLCPFIQIMLSWQPYRDWMERVPLGRLMLDRPSPARLSAWAREGLAEMAGRKAKGSLSYEASVLYERALQWAGKTDEAIGLLDDMDRQFPARRMEVLALRAATCRSRNDWPSLYEALRQIKVLRRSLDPDFQHGLAEAMVKIGMGACALELLESELARHPDDSSTRVMIASLWEQFGFTEESRFVLKSHPSAMVGAIGNPGETGARLQELPRLPPAENVMTWDARPGKVTPGPMVALEGQPGADASPFLRALRQMTRDWSSQSATARQASPILWKAVGRDSMEQATALHCLACLAAEAGDLSLARKALDHALQLMPTARLLWRMRIAVAGQDAVTMVPAARRACPSDPEIWLATLVVTLRAGQIPDAAAALNAACVRGLYPPATRVRAGTALMRAGDAVSAAVAAKSAVTESPGYMPACLLGLDAAMAVRDTNSAVTYALQIATRAPDPLPYLQTAARWGAAGNARDTALIRPLETLIRLQPDESEWPLRLGALYCRNGLYQMAHDTFGRWVLTPPGDTDPDLFCMMAESARLSEDLSGSLAVLREATKRFPSDMQVISRLAWALAQTPETLAEARALLPRLAAGAPTPSCLDTMAMINLRSGNVEEARRCITRALTRLKPDDSHWLEIHLNATEIECERGRPLEAEKLLQKAIAQQHAAILPFNERILALKDKIRAIRRHQRR